MMQKMKEQDQTKSTNIKWHNLTINREKLEKMRGHKGMVIWFTGLSGSCLLYTSPSPRDVEESRMPSSA